MRSLPRHCVLFFAALHVLTASTLFAKDGAPGKSTEDSRIINFHSLGDVGGRTNIYRCANPVDEIADRLKGAEPTEADRAEAKAQMQHLYDKGVRTVVSLQRQEPPTEKAKNPEYQAVQLEKAAAEEVGLTYVGYSLSNHGKGPQSLQYMPEDESYKIVDEISADIVKRSENGGVIFHCKSGKDRTGLVAGYIRMKYQGWSLDEALVEMRERGHVWKKFLKPGNTFSWHEEHLRAMAKHIPTAKESTAP